MNALVAINNPSRPSMGQVCSISDAGIGLQEIFLLIDTSSPAGKFKATPSPKCPC